MAFNYLNSPLRDKSRSFPKAEGFNGNNILDSVTDLSDTSSGGFVTESLRLAFPSDVPPEQHIVMCFTAYFDESGTHEGSAVVTLAGYLSTAERWEVFDAQWKPSLEKYGIEFFHMADFAQRQGQFRNWPEDKRRECLKELHDIISANAIGSVGYGLSRAAYDAIVCAKADDFMGGPYGLLASTLLIDFSGLLRLLGVRSLVAYRFESGAEGIGQVATIFDRNIASPGHSEFHRVLSFGTEDKRKFTPLQAADILAYELYEQLPRQLGLDPKPPRPFPLPSLARVPHLWGYINERNLATFNKIASIAANLSKEDFDYQQAQSEPARDRCLITISEFQARWRWYVRLFMVGEAPTTARRTR
jgi:hypothetical protein